MKRETRVVPEDEAVAFAQNMRWFAGQGKISLKPLRNGRVLVKATPGAFSNFVFSKTAQIPKTVVR